MRINPTLFREYDIRGRIDRQDGLTEEAIYAIGGGFAVFLQRRGITDAIVGQDARPYSARVKDITVQALLASGINVIDIGTVLAPMFYFSQYFLSKKGGVMITASHNPWGWSGFKHAYDYSTTLIPADMQELQEIIAQGAFVKGAGRRESRGDVPDAYKKDTLGRIALMRPLRVLVDTGNGTGGLFVPQLLREAGCDVIEQYTEVKEVRDHEANPSTLGMLNAMATGVRKHRVDIGLGFDDDGDRLGAVDEQGKPIWPDQILLLLARPILAKHPGAKVVFDVKSTEALVEDIRARGGVPVMWKTGHSYIKAKAKEIGAHLAGERSGHMYFPKEHYAFDDAAYAGLKLLEYMSGRPEPISAIMRELPQYVASPVWHAPCPDKKKYAVVAKLTDLMKKEYGADRVIDINGARVYVDGGWGLVRASSNVPALVLVFEAKDEAGLKNVEEIFRKKLAQFPEVGAGWKSG